MDWEHRAFVPVELPADAEALRVHGRNGGWITAVLESSPAEPVKLLGMVPMSGVQRADAPVEQADIRVR
jgi:hypothetical protein